MRDPLYLKINSKLLTLKPGQELTTREIARPLQISTTTIIKRFGRYGIIPKVVKEGFTNRAFKWNTTEILNAVQKDMNNDLQGDV